MEGLRELSTLVTISAEFLELLTPELCVLEVNEGVTRVTWGLLTTWLMAGVKRGVTTWRVKEV